MAINQLNRQHITHFPVNNRNHYFDDDGHGSNLNRKQPQQQQQRRCKKSSSNNFLTTACNRINNMIISSVEQLNLNHHNNGNMINKSINIVVIISLRLLYNVDELKSSTSPSTTSLDPTMLIIDDGIRDGDGNQQWNISNSTIIMPRTSTMLKKLQRILPRNDSGMFSLSSSINSDGNTALYSSTEDGIVALSSLSSPPSIHSLSSAQRKPTVKHTSLIQKRSSFDLSKQSKCQIPGSLESINLEEEDEDSFFSEPLNFLAPPSSSSSSTTTTSVDVHIESPVSWTSSPLYEQRAVSSSLHSIDSIQLDHDPPPFASESFVQSLEYPCWNELCLYFNLNRMFDDDSCSMSKTSCSRFVNRFGTECLDICRFPLVLPVFTADLLERRASFTTWQRLMLEADALLSIWELSALKNLYHRFDNDTKSFGVVLGKPIDWIQIDPNHHLRQICHQLTNHLSAKKDKHQVLKRWSSNEDLFLNKSSEFQNLNKSESRCKTDDSFWTINNIKYRLKQSTVRMSSSSSSASKSHVDQSRRKKNSKSLSSSASFNRLFTSINNWQQECNIVYRELSSLLQHSSSVHFALYVTRFHQEYFRHRLFGDFFIICTHLVLPKQVFFYFL